MSQKVSEFYNRFVISTGIHPNIQMTVVSPSCMYFLNAVQLLDHFVSMWVLQLNNIHLNIIVDIV